MRKNYERFMFTFERATSCKQEVFLFLILLFSLTLQYLLHFLNVRRRRCQQLASLKHYEMMMMMMNCVSSRSSLLLPLFLEKKKLKYNNKKKKEQTTMTRTIAFKISVKTLIKYWHGNDDCNREVDTYYFEKGKGKYI